MLHDQRSTYNLIVCTQKILIDEWWTIHRSSPLRHSHILDPRGRPAEARKHNSLWQNGYVHPQYGKIHMLVSTIRDIQSDLTPHCSNVANDKKRIAQRKVQIA